MTFNQHEDEKNQFQDEQQARLDEYRRLIRNYLPFEKRLARAWELAKSDNKQVRHQALKLVKKMERSQELAANQSAGERAESDALPGKPSPESEHVTVEKGDR